MARNLRDKIRTVLQDSYDIRQESMISRIEKLVTDELQLREEEREITHQDLSYIQALSVKEFSEMRMDREALGYIHDDKGMIRTLCMVNATVSFLRNKGLLTALIKYKK